VAAEDKLVDLDSGKFFGELYDKTMENLDAEPGEDAVVAEVDRLLSATLNPPLPFGSWKSGKGEFVSWAKDRYKTPESLEEIAGSRRVVFKFMKVRSLHAQNSSIPRPPPPSPNVSLCTPRTRTSGSVRSTAAKTTNYTHVT
jgi:hypothetical protein